MLSVFLFIIFFAAYAYLFVPSRKASAVVLITSEPVAEVGSIVPTDLPETVEPSKPLEPQPSYVAAEIAVTELVITPAELAELEVEPTPTLAGYAAMGVRELRKVCTSAGIKWRNFNGKNQHMSKDQMLEALAV